MSEKSVKGSVRRKVKALPSMMNMLTESLLLQETFVKNNISCSFASSDSLITVGFVTADKSRPMTLLANNELNDTKPVSLILRRKTGDALFNQVIVGDMKEISRYADKIKDIVLPDMLTQI